VPVDDEIDLLRRAVRTPEGVVASAVEVVAVDDEGRRARRDLLRQGGLAGG
jgi:hypothetical protein